MKVALLGVVVVLLCVVGVVSSAVCTREVSPFASNVWYVGRVQPTSNGQGAQFDWSAIEIHFNVSGATKVAARFTDNQNGYNIFLNGNQLGFINTTSSQTLYTVASNLNRNQNYQLVLGKRTEALFGVATFNGFVLTTEEEDESECGKEDKDPIVPSSLISVREPARKIEFIGDSISCGCGIDGQAGCHFSAGTENSYHTYGSIISRNLRAELHLECWSGKGVVRNYGDHNQLSTDPFPIYYPRTLASVSQSSWDFSSWVPRAVVINLGTNDFSTQPHPTEQQFTTGYYNFITKIRTEYASNPGLQFFLVCGPLIGNPCCQYVKEVAQKEGSNFHYIDMQGILSYPADYGCDGHPNAIGHQKMAGVAQPIIKAVMGW